MEKTRVSQKQIAANLEAIGGYLTSIRKEVMNMPECSKKKSLLLTLEAFEKKVSVQVKEITEEQALAYVNSHPEVLQRLAHFARSDEGAKEVSAAVVTTDDLKNEEIEYEQKQKPTKKRRL